MLIKSSSPLMSVSVWLHDNWSEDEKHDVCHSWLDGLNRHWHCNSSLTIILCDSEENPKTVNGISPLTIQYLVPFFLTKRTEALAEKALSQVKIKFPNSTCILGELRTHSGQYSRSASGWQGRLDSPFKRAPGETQVGGPSLDYFFFLVKNVK